jgi:hypothetical protein
MNQDISTGFAKEAGVARELILRGGALRRGAASLGARATAAGSRFTRRIGEVGADVGRAVGRGAGAAASGVVTAPARAVGAAGQAVGGAAAATGRAAQAAGGRIQGAVMGARMGRKRIQAQGQRVVALRGKVRELAAAPATVRAAKKVRAAPAAPRVRGWWPEWGGAKRAPISKDRAARAAAPAAKPSSTGRNWLFGGGVAAAGGAGYAAAGPSRAAGMDPRNN